VPPAGYGWLPLLAGVALAEAVRRLAELPAVLKWPNDLLVAARGSADEPRKCAGILAEAVPGKEPGAPGAVVLGVGLNVTQRAEELPTSPTGLPATSLQLAGAVATDRDPLVRALLRGLDEWYRRWRAAGGDPGASGLHEAYLRYCGTVGRQVRVLLPDGADLVGRAVTVDPDGRLVLDTPSGERRVAAGDIRHLREP
jgi:BirA family biotin operon repressor/biotin-[acetyl-CoA-carboxylase] ligase